jgi:hypothetical protein
MANWENEKMMRLAECQVDKTALGWSVKLAKWQVDDLASWQKAIWWNSISMKHQVDKMAIWWNCMLTKSQIDEISS